MIKEINKILFCDESDDIKLEMLYQFFKWRSQPVSSNVKNMMYNDEISELTIEFKSGDIYTYFNINIQTFLNITQKLARAKTTGSNQWGSWKKGDPSAGAGVHQFLIDAGVSYSKGGTLR